MLSYFAKQQKKERGINLIRKSLSAISFLWGIFIILIAFGDHIKETLELLSFVLIAFLGVTYLISSLVIIRPDIGINFCSSRSVVNYTLVMCILFFLIPVLDQRLTGGVDTMMLKIYENGFVFGPLLVSLVLAINLRLTGQEIERRHAKYIFWMLSFICALSIGFVLMMVVAVISALA